MPAGWGRRIRYAMQQYAVNSSPPTAAASTHVALNPTDPLDSAVGYTAGTTEPASTNGYARQAITWQFTVGAYTSITADATVEVTNNGAISFGPSVGGGFSPSGPYTFVSHWNTATLATVAETAYWGRAAVSAPTQSVGGAGITLTIASGALKMGCITS
jgi:hypothetical protein